MHLKTQISSYLWNLDFRALKFAYILHNGEAAESMRQRLLENCRATFRYQVQMFHILPFLQKSISQNSVAGLRATSSLSNLKTCNERSYNQRRDIWSAWNQGMGVDLKRPAAEFYSGNLDLRLGPKSINWRTNTGSENAEFYSGNACKPICTYIWYWKSYWVKLVATLNSTFVSIG